MEGAAMNTCLRVLHERNKMNSELSLKFIVYFPDYLSALSRTLLRFSWTTFVETAVKTGTRRITSQDELSSAVRLERRTTEDSSSSRIMRLVPVFILETHNQTNNNCSPKFVQTNNASSSMKLRIGSCLACVHVYRVMDARGKFGEHERSVRVARRVANIVTT